MSNIVAFYNIFAEGERYQAIVQSQVEKLQSTGLLSRLDAVNYVTIGKGKLTAVNSSI